MSDLLQAIADVECASAFQAFDRVEIATLRRYHDLCAALGESGFLRQEVRFTFKASREESYEKLEHAGPAELRSAMLDLRQLWMKRERTYFPAIRNLLRRKAAGMGSAASADAVKHLDAIGRRYAEALSRPLMGIVDKSNPAKRLKNISAEQVIEDWLYAGAVHWDEERAARVERWSKVSYEFSLSKALHALCDSYWELDLLVQGILGEDSPLEG